ncbi:hypothetical protein [Treponema sp.]|uniref:hypothetical protein n=1 Tax=Treponema sp. TaxID=166 RepID=UPI003FA1D408
MIKQVGNDIQGLKTETGNLDGSIKKNAEQANRIYENSNTILEELKNGLPRSVETSKAAIIDQIRTSHNILEELKQSVSDSSVMLTGNNTTLKNLVPALSQIVEEIKQNRDLQNKYRSEHENLSKQIVVGIGKKLSEQGTAHEQRLSKIEDFLYNKITGYEKQVVDAAARNTELSGSLHKATGLYEQEKEKNAHLQEEWRNYKEKCEKEIAKVNEEKGIINAELSDLRTKYEIFDPFTAEYKNILNAALACVSVLPVLYDIKSTESTKDILRFLLIFGEDLTFANKVYSSIREYNVQKKEGLKPEEYHLIGMLNEFYKTQSGVDFDVFELPQEEGDKIRFDKFSMQDADKPADTQFKSIDCLYVPALRKDAKTFAFKAIVNGVK